jgi:DNA-binding transcriptional LysR family regulator
MERLRRVASLWSWLPAFRAVAETQHLPTASEQLLVSASALSRTIRLLESDVGHRLFLRSGRRIELNEAGQRFLVSVRNAMRLVHDGLVALEGASLRGPVYVSAVELVATAHVLPGLRRLRQTNPGLVPHLRRDAAEELAPRLLRGQLDVAFVTHPAGDAQLATTHLGRTTGGIYCAPAHPLYERASADLDEVLAHPFVAATPGRDGMSYEGWPPALGRTIAMYVAGQAMAVDACVHGGLLAVLPDAALNSGANPHRLRRLPLDVVTPTDVFALTRQALAEGGRAASVAEAVAATFDQSGDSDSA